MPHLGPPLGVGINPDAGISEGLRLIRDFQFAIGPSYLGRQKARCNDREAVSRRLMHLMRYASGIPCRRNENSSLQVQLV